MAPMATFVQSKTDTAIADKNKVFSKASKKEHVAAKEAYGDVIEEVPSPRDSSNKELTVEGPSYAECKTSMQSAKSVTLNNICARLNLQNADETHRHAQSPMKRNNRRISDRTATIMQETPGRKVVHR